MAHRIPPATVKKRVTKGRGVEGKDLDFCPQPVISWPPRLVQIFFRFYGKLAGMTGTATPAAAEFFELYRLKVHTVIYKMYCQLLKHFDIVLSCQKPPPILLSLPYQHLPVPTATGGASTHQPAQLAPRPAAPAVL